MALLDAVARYRLAAQWMRDNDEDCSFDKAALVAAIAAADTWIEASTPSFVSSLPAAFRTNSSAGQKAMLFAFVMMRRIGRLRTAEDG